MPTLILSRSDIRGLLDMRTVIKAVEQAFKELGTGEAKMPPKAYLTLDKGDFRAMPASLPGAAGMKWVNVHPQNPATGMPTVMAVLVFNDPATGYPLAVMDATEITAYRTGATAAVAAKYLARKDSHTLGLIGAGQQAYTQLSAHALLFDLKRINVFDIARPATERLIAAFPQFPVQPSTLAEAAASDIVCTVTPARAPILKKELVVPGTHLNAIGADAAGKEELEPSILLSAKVVVDDIEQSSNGGEINVPVSKGIFKVSDIYGTLDEIITGKKPGREDKNEVTIFDSTGLAIEDIAVAKFIYSKAQKAGKYLSLNLVEG